MKKSLSGWLRWAVMLAALFFMMLPQTAAAENIFVEDYAGILNASQKAEIENINKDFENLDGHPQYAVVTLKNLDDEGSIEDFAEKKFKELGIGSAGFDNGFLFVIAIEDQEYRLEVGYGVEDVITDSMKDDIVSDAAVDKLKDGDYGAAVMEISKNVQTIVKARYGDYEVSKAQVLKEKEERDAMIKHAAFGFVLFALITIGVVCFGLAYDKAKLAKIAKMLQTGHFPPYIHDNPKIYIEGDDYKKAGKLFVADERLYTIQMLDVLAIWIKTKAWTKQLKAGDPQCVKALEDYAFDLVFQDAVIQQSFDSQYPVSIFIQEKYLTPGKTSYEKQAGHAYPISTSFIENYVAVTEARHTHDLEVVEDNKASVRARCRAYLHTLRRVPKRETLFVYLMAYYFLRNRELSDEDLLQEIDFSEESLTKAYRFAKSKNNEIEEEYVSSAIRDLDAMTLGTYMAVISSWGMYGGGSSGGFGGGGGGSSFGGGSSGGGGFSGGW